jgi:hypothetical protein
VVVTFQILTEAGLLSFISTTTIFGTPDDVTLQELAVKSFFPVNTQTSAALAGLVSTGVIS